MNQINQELIKFHLNKQIFKAKRIKKNEKLIKARQLLGLDLPENSLFTYSDGTLIEKEDEIYIEINDLLDNNNIYLIKNEDNNSIYNELLKKRYNVPKWLRSHKKTLENEKQEKNNETNNSIKELKIDIDCVPQTIKKKLKYMPPPIKYSNSNYYITTYQENKKNENNDNQNNNIIGRKTPSISSCIKIERNNNLDIYLYPKFNFYEFEERKSLSFMVVGESGSGKTTLLNSFVNFLLGVKINDEYRYKIILERTNKSQSNSQTSQVNIYNIRSVGGYPPIRIIDTPGFGDTEGIDKDKETFEKILKFFKENLKEINAICFVIKSSNNRLTIHQKYILNRILDIFGKDMKENFVFLLTFCDGGLPNVIEPLKSADSPVSELIESLNQEKWYFKFNNSTFYEENIEEEMTEIFWKLGIKNFEKFLSRLKNLEKKNLYLTKEVLKERELLEETAEKLNNELKQGLNKVYELENKIKEISMIKNDINTSKEYQKIIKVSIVKKIKKNPNFYASTCLVCNITCHSNCEIADDDEKQKCKLMDKNGFCTICPNKCKWDQHKNTNYILQEAFEEKITIFEELKKRYDDCINKLPKIKENFIQERARLMKIYEECIKYKNIICEGAKNLKKIALKKNCETYEDFFDVLIEVEKSENKPGWEQRLRYLENLKEQKKIIKEIFEGNNSQMNKIEEFINSDLININLNNI